MEDIIGFLIILVSIIVSIVSSVSKKSRSKTAPVTTEANKKNQNFSTEIYDDYENQETNAAITDSPDMTVEEKRKQIEEKKYSDYERQKEAQDAESAEDAEAEGQIYEEDEDAVTEESPQKESKQPESRQPEKAAQKRPGRGKSRKRTPVEEIQQDFNVEKGILYTEILNRKHF
jgi:hypothetical protein